MSGWWSVAGLAVLDLGLWRLIYSAGRASAADRRLWGLAGSRRPDSPRALLVERWVDPVRAGISGSLHRIIPEERRRRAADRLFRAGLGWDPAHFAGLRIIAGLACLAASALSRGSAPLSGGTLAWMAAAAGVGYLAPALWVRRRIAERDREFRRALPEALDLLSICLRAGLGFQAAVAEYARTASGAAGEAFRRYLADLALGLTPEAGIREMVRRHPGDELATVSAGLIQGIRLGSPLADFLEEQARHIRTLGLRRAEEGARRLSTQLVLPLVAFIFPQVFIIGFGPVALRLFAPGGLLR